MRKIRRQIILIAFCLIIGQIKTHASNALSDGKSLDIYILRHAETLANVTDVYTPENIMLFSEKGQGQAEKLPEKLKAYHFDHILVSPMPRALYTILPYLEKNGMTAEIWPELEECCWQKEQDMPPSENISMGAAISLGEKMKEYFRFRNNFSMRYYNQKNYVDGIALQRKAAKMLITRFGNSGKSILVVGHYHAAGRLIEILLGLPSVGRFNLNNASLAHLMQRKDSSFQLIMLNDMPYTP